jgi:hypothetical protein
MANAFDVRVATVPVVGTPAAAEGYPLFHVSAAGGAITILEAFQTCVVACSTLGSLNLFYGTLSAAGGTIVPEATIGTSIGTCDALSLAAIDLVASPCVVPANKWIGINAETAFGTGKCPSIFTMAYVRGRQVS